MAEVTVYDAVRMKAIEDNTVVNGHIDAPSGHLKLTRFNTTEIDAGLVNVSPRIVTSGTRPAAPDRFEGLQIYETDTNLWYVWDGAAWLPLAMTIPHTTSVRVAANGGASASAAFVGLAVACSIANFPKLRADTKIIAEYDGGVYNDESGGLGGFEVAILINGVDQVVAGGFANVAQKSGKAEVTGLAVGTYTCSLRKRRTNVGNVVDGHVGARNTLTLTETF